VTVKDPGPTSYQKASYQTECVKVFPEEEGIAIFLMYGGLAVARERSREETGARDTADQGPKNPVGGSLESKENVKGVGGGRGGKVFLIKLCARRVLGPGGLLLSHSKVRGSSFVGK